MEFYRYFINKSKIGRRLFITKVTISFYSILLFIDGNTALEIRNGYGYINFWLMYAIVSLMIFIEELIDIIVYRKLPKIEITHLQGEPIGGYNNNIYIDGILKENLAIFILENNGLPTIASKEVLGLTTEEVKKLWDNLERVGILERGKNNARVLRVDDLDIITKTLEGVVDSDDLTPPLLRVWENSYNYLKA